jgi:hypothetical protein
LGGGAITVKTLRIFFGDTDEARVFTKHENTKEKEPRDLTLGQFVYPSKNYILTGSTKI